MASPPPSLEDEEYPGVYWVKAYWLLYNLKDGERMPRCQDLPANAFGHLRDATRVFAVTHPWLGRYSPDPDGIQVETLRSKLSSMAEQMLLDRKDVLFFDYLSLPQVHHESGKDDRTEEQLRRFKTALSGDLMGRIFLTSRVLVIDEVPKEAVSNTEFLNRGWCFFECVVASMNALARDLLWVSEKTKSEIARFRKLSAKFRETGELDELLQKFDTELKSKKFALKADAAMVRGFFRFASALAASHPRRRRGGLGRMREHARAKSRCDCARRLGPDGPARGVTECAGFGRRAATEKPLLSARRSDEDTDERNVSGTRKGGWVT